MAGVEVLDEIEIDRSSGLGMYDDGEITLGMGIRILDWRSDFGENQIGRMNILIAVIDAPIEQ